MTAFELDTDNGSKVVMIFQEIVKSSSPFEISSCIGSVEIKSKTNQKFKFRKHC